MSAHHAPPQRPALWRHLWAWTLVAMAATWATLAAVAYHTGLHEADEISDGQLMATAHLWLQLPQVPQAHANTTHPSGLQPAQHGYEQPQALMVWERGMLVLDTHGLAEHWPVPDQPGFHTQLVTVQGQSRHWREYTATASTPHERRVTVVMDLDARNALGRDIALHIASPAFVVLPLVALLLAWALRRGLRPLHQLSAELDRLDVTRHQRLGEQHRFSDFASTVGAINALADRLDAQLQQERAFASDIAHELRTPLTAISLQAHVAALADTPDQRAAAARQLEAQALQAGDILAQLLDFARAQRAEADTLQPVVLADWLPRWVGEHAQTALDRGQDLSLHTAPDVQQATVSGRPLLLALAVRNLVDNALRHNPPGTKVAVSLQRQGSGLLLAVDDDGPPATATSASAGLGLGVTLVKRIAQWHGAQWHTEPPPPPATKRHALLWPAPEPPHTEASARG